MGQRHDPYLSSRFLVEVDGLIVGGFSEVAGFQSELEMEEYREGGVNHHVRQFPKGVKYPNLSLKRGITDSDVLWKWYDDVRQGTIKRRTVNIICLDSQGNRKLDWQCVNAYPIKWAGPDFVGQSSNVAIESIELTHEGIVRD